MEMLVRFEEIIVGKPFAFLVETNPPFLKLL